MNWPAREEEEEVEDARREEEEEDKGELDEKLGKSIEGNIGRKKLQKLQDKAEEKKQREVEQQVREENKKRGKLLIRKRSWRERERKGGGYATRRRGK